MCDGGNTFKYDVGPTSWDFTVRINSVKILKVPDGEGEGEGAQIFSEGTGGLISYYLFYMCI